MLIKAILVGLIMFLVKFFDWGFINIMPRPIWIGPLVGLVLGDLPQGCIIGAAIEAVFMGTFTVGGSVPSDITAAAVFGTAFGILTGKGVNTGVALSIPVGLLAVLLFNLVCLFFNFVVAYEDKTVTQHHDKKFTHAHFFAMFFYPTVFFIATVIVLEFGVIPVQHFMNNLPAQVNQMLNVMAQLLPALGMAILISSMLDKEIVPLFFVGFALAAYLKLNTMAIAILAGAFAVYFVFNDFNRHKEINSLKENQNQKNSTANNETEDFFS